MRRKNQCYRTRMQQEPQLGGIRAGFGPPLDTLVRQRVSLVAIVLILLMCITLPAPGQFESGQWGILSARRKEYMSNDVPKDIPGRGTETSTLTITDAGPISDVDVKLNITHPYDADLDIYLIAPDGTRIELVTDVGVSEENYTDTIFDNEAAESITDGQGPFTGSYRPEGNLSNLYGKEMSGTWTLEVTDDWSSSRAGTLNSWSLIMTFEVSEPLSPPVIQTKAGTNNTVIWEDIGEARQYDSGNPEAIPDQDTLMSELVINDTGMIQDLNVLVNISHSVDSDIDAFLIAPDGTRVELFTDVGGSGDNFEDTILDDEAANSITKGSAPFAGSYQPEGNLADLVGLNICGTWTLEITDDAWLSSGTLNSWSLIVDVADVAYYGQCASDDGFSTIVANSGWIANTSYTFSGLSQTKKYWYRVKARPMESWFQGARGDFEKGVLTDTVVTTNDDIILAGSGGGLGPELNVIADPSFESDTLEGWYADLTTFDILIGAISKDLLWASDGTWAGCVIFFSDFNYQVNELGVLYQPVDWTGVETFVFDYANFAYANLLVAAVFVGDTLVWMEGGTDASTSPNYIDAHYDETIDVSAFEGVQDLGLVVQSLVAGRYDAGILWDNLRTYGPSGYAPSGEIISTDTWGTLSFNATIPAGTELTIDVLPEEGSEPIPGYEDIVSGTDLSGIGEKIIRLRANLSTSDQTVSPVLHNWSISYTDSVRESDWSNVVSSS
jgi:subtilisin-like proprotein convertase family protein